MRLRGVILRLARPAQSNVKRVSGEATIVQIGSSLGPFGRCNRLDWFASIYVLAAAAAVLLPLQAAPQSRPPEVDLPRWEIGIGAIARVATEYPGAEHYRTSLTPIPYLKYRGRFLELGGDQTFRLVPFRTDSFELGFSFDGSSRVDNRESAPGTVQPDLDALVEFGPEFIFRLAERPALVGDRAGGRLEAVLQTRGVFSIRKGVSYEGAVIRPALRYRQNGALRPGSRLQASIGPVFATEGVQDKYYEVAPGSDDPGYDAAGGFLGTEMRAAIRYPLTSRLNAIGGFAATYLGGGVNSGSPLRKSDWDAAVFLGLTVSLYRSKARGVRDR